MRFVIRSFLFTVVVVAFVSSLFVAAHKALKCPLFLSR